MKKKFFWKYLLVEEDDTYITEFDKIISDIKYDQWEEFKNNLESYRNVRKGVVYAVNSNNLQEAKKSIYRKWNQ